MLALESMAGAGAARCMYFVQGALVILSEGSYMVP